MGLAPSRGNDGKYIKGVWVDQARIIEASDVTSSATLPCDVAIQLTLDIGKSFNPKLTIYGDFKKDERGTLVGWGSAFKIDRLINTIGGWNRELETANIPGEALSKLLNKDIFFLKYVIDKGDEPGKFKYRSYQIVANLMEWDADTKQEIPGDEWLLKRFQREVANGYVKSFRPELLDETAAATAASAAPVTEEDPF